MRSDPPGSSGDCSIAARERLTRTLDLLQLTRSIHRTPAYADIPIIICTSKNQETDRVWGLRQGASDYITKPVNAQELMEKIKALG